MARIMDWFTKRPKPGEQTDRQKAPALGGDIGDVASQVRLDASSPSKGDYKTYRKMRAHPTIALARAIAQAPNMTAGYAVQLDEDDDAIHDAVETMLDALWPFLIHNAMFALDYGWQPFEKVWAVDGPLLTITKLKPLLPDMTEIIVDEHGAFAGLKQRNVVLPPENSLVLTYDQEAGNLYGRSRHENVRGVWDDEQKLAKKQDKYNTKVSGVIPIIEYPEGSSRDRNGAEQDNYKLAERVLASLGSGNGVAMPNTLARYAVELARNGVALDSVKAWHLDFLEAKGSHAGGFIDQRRYHDSLLFRGWLIPERVATEGQMGTKAEASAHADIALVIADMFFEAIIRHANWYLVDPFVAYNFGAAKVGTVRLESVGLDRAQRAFYRSLLEKVLSNPQNIDVLLDLIEIREMADAVGLPVTEEQEILAPDKQPPTDGQQQPDGGADPEGDLASIYGDAHSGG
ncbi:MAG TPA: hypothetical protein VM487_11390 [Phycisphaerae bacterium]|nr:hypothetical protein [Phycisphaerae bacterium]